MQLTFTQPNQVTNRANNFVCRFGLGLAIALAAISLLLVSTEANAQGSAYFGRQSAAYNRSPVNAVRNIQQQAINQIISVRQIADSRTAQAYVQKQRGNTLYPAPRAAVQVGSPVAPAVVRGGPAYGVPSRGYNRGCRVIHIHELGFDATPIHGRGLRIVHVSWHGIASDIGLDRGDLLLQINGHHVCSRDEVYHAIHHAHHGDLEFVFRDARTGRIKVRTACLH